VWDKCAKTGAWTLRAVASLTASPSASAGEGGPMQDLEASLEDLLTRQVPEVPPAAGGDGYDRLQRVCRDLNSDVRPNPADMAALSPLQHEWLQILDPQMRLLVGNVPKSALVDHVRGRKVLRGVIPLDQGSVDAWNHADAIEQMIADL